MLTSKATHLPDLLYTTQTNKVVVYDRIEKILKRKSLTFNDLEGVIQILKKILSDGNDNEKQELLRRWVVFSKRSNDLCVQLLKELCRGGWGEGFVEEIVSSLIVEQALNLGECFKLISNDQLCHKIIETLIQVSPSVPLKPYLNFIHINTIRNIFETNNDSTRTVLYAFVLKIVKSAEFSLEACDEQIRNHVLDNFKNVYIMIIEDLRKSNNRIWYDLFMFTFKYMGKLIHNEIGLLNALLSNIENGFKSKLIEDKILSFECWKVLIDVASLDRNYLCSSKQLKLLIKPLKVKLSRHDLVTQKRLDVWLHLLTALQENSLQCLEEFMNFCFEAETSIVKDVWLQRTEVFMSIIGHYETGDCCISPRTFMLNKPLIDGGNILRYKTAVLHALTICSDNMLVWEVKTEREKKIRCMWRSIFRIIGILHRLDKELILRDLFVVMTTFWKKYNKNQGYFDDILQPIFNILSNLDAESYDYLLLNEIIVFPMAQLMLNTSDIPEYIALSFVNLIRSCSKTGSVLEYLNRSCELLRSYSQNKTQVLSAYIWLELANEMLNVCRSPKDNQFEAYKNSLKFLMCWICECQIPENLQKMICDKWISIMTEMDVICEDFNNVVMRHFQKILKDNPSIVSNILGFIPFSIEKISEDSPISYVTKVVDIVLEILKIPCLNKNKVPLALPIIPKISAIISKENDGNEIETLSIKLFECLEYFLKPHQVFDVLKLFKTILPKLPQSIKKRIPVKLRTIITDLTTHSNSEIAQNAIALVADLNKQYLLKPPTNFATPTVSSRTAKIASLASSNHIPIVSPLNLFAQTVQKSPVTVKGSIINNMNTPKSSRALKIANAMPSFKKPSNINDANSQDFVYIDSQVNVDYSKMVSHQKEVLKRRKEDIPALYQDLSQSQSQHSYDSLSRSNDCLSNDENKNGNKQEISDNQSNVIILRNVVVSPNTSQEKDYISPNHSFDGVNEMNKSNESETLSSATDLSSLCVDENSIEENSENRLMINQNESSQIIGEVELSLDGKNVRRRKSLRKNERSFRKNAESGIQEISDIEKNSTTQNINENIDLDENKTKKPNRKPLHLKPSNKSNPTKKRGRKKKDRNNTTNINEEAILNPDETVYYIDFSSQENNHVQDDEVKQDKQKERLLNRAMNKLKMDIVGADKFIHVETSKQKLRRIPNILKKDFETNKSVLIPNWNEKHKIECEINEVFKENTPKITPIESSTENIVKSEEIFDNTSIISVKEENKELIDKKFNSDSTDINESPKTQSENEIKQEKQPKTLIDDAQYQKDNTKSENNSPEQDGKAKKKGKREIKRLQMNIVGADSFVGVTQKRATNLRSNDAFNSLIGVKRRRSQSDANTSGIGVKRRRRSKKIKNSNEDLLFEDGSNKRENGTEDLSQCLLMNTVNKNNENETNLDVTKLDEDIIENSQPQNKSILHLSKTPSKLNKINVIKNESNNSTFITLLPLKIIPSNVENNIVCCDPNISIDNDESSFKNQDTIKSSNLTNQNINESNNISPKAYSMAKIISPVKIGDNSSSNTKISIDIDLRNENRTISEPQSITQLPTKSPPIIKTDELSPEKILTKILKSPNIPNKINDDTLSCDSNKGISTENSPSTQHGNQNTTETVRNSARLKNILNVIQQKLNKISPGYQKAPVSKNLKTIPTNKLDDTLSCDPNESISVSIQEVTPPLKSGHKSKLVKTTPNPLGNITLDDFPTGLNKNDEQNLPGSPIIENRNSELLNNTIDISPIKVEDEVSNENNGNGNKIETEIVNNNLDISENCKTDSQVDFKFELPTDIANFKSEIATNFMKAPSARSMKLMNLLPQLGVANVTKSPKSVVIIRKQNSNLNGSPTSTERVRRMMLNCNGNKSLEGEKDKVRNEEKVFHILEFRKDVPSPFATPNRSILKRKAYEALDCGISPGPKRKRVNFSDPPITAEKIYYKEQTEDISENDSCLSEVNQRKSTPIYPSLIDSLVDIKEVLKEINQDNSFYDNFLSLKLNTVGDLARLTSTQVNHMEFLNNPKLSTIVSALSAFSDKCNSKEKLGEQEESSMVPTEDPNLPVNGDTENNALLVSYSERLKRLNTNISEKWQNFKNQCTREELILISGDLQEFLEPR